MIKDYYFNPDIKFKEVSSNILDILNRPLPQEALSSAGGFGLTSIKPIFVTERLNEAFGIGGWKTSCEIININDLPYLKEGNGFTVIANVTLVIPKYGIYFNIVASSNNKDVGDAAKGANSDATGKIASFLGIGANVYKGLQNENGIIKPSLHPKHPKWDEIKLALKGNKTTLVEILDQYEVTAGIQVLLKA